jgi:Holliday junction DNA helicase RuvB
MIDLKGDYPEHWDDFIGQTQAKRKLLVASRSAKLRKEPMDHCLIFCGKAGVGKTALAQLAAREMESNVVCVSGTLKAAEVRVIVSRMKPHDVLFYDEVHQAVAGGRAKGEWLLGLLQDGVLPGARGKLEPMPPITVIGATTDMGRLPATILTRFSPVELVDYTEDEATRVALKLAARMFPTPMPLPSVEVAERIARACNQNPRTMRQLLINIRDITLTDAKMPDEEGQYDIVEAMQWMGLDDAGITDMAKRYMVALVKDFGGEPTGEAAMKDRLDEPGGLRITERLLMDHGLLEKTRQGRMPTAAGLTFAEAQMENAA